MKKFNWKRVLTGILTVCTVIGTASTMKEDAAAATGGILPIIIDMSIKDEDEESGFKGERVVPPSRFVENSPSESAEGRRHGYSGRPGPLSISSAFIDNENVDKFIEAVADNSISEVDGIQWVKVKDYPYNLYYDELMTICAWNALETRTEFLGFDIEDARYAVVMDKSGVFWLLRFSCNNGFGEWISNQSLFKNIKNITDGDSTDNPIYGVIITPGALERIITGMKVLDSTSERKILVPVTIYTDIGPVSGEDIEKDDIVRLIFNVVHNKNITVEDGSYILTPYINGTPEWFNTILDLSDGIADILAQNGAIKVTTGDGYVDFTITKNSVRMSAGGTRVDITGWLNAQASKINSEHKCIITELGSGVDSSATYTILSGKDYIEVLATLLNNFDMEYEGRKNSGGRATVMSGVDNEYLKLSDTDSYAIYKKASGALNKYTVDGKLTGWTSTVGYTDTSDWSPYAPELVNSMSLQPVTYANNMRAGLYLHENMLMQTFPDVDYGTIGMYVKPTSVGYTSSGTLTTEDIYVAVRDVSLGTDSSTVSVTEQNVAVNYGKLVKYLSQHWDTGIKVGSDDTPVADGLGVETDLTAIPANTMLQALIDGIDYTMADTYQPNFSAPMPVLTNVPKCDTPEGVEAYLNAVYYTVLTDGFAISNFLTMDKSGNYECKIGQELADIAKGHDTDYLSKMELSNKQILFIKVVLSMNEGIEYLGIRKDYSKSVQLLLSYVDCCTLFNSNSNISAYNPTMDTQPMKAFFDLDAKQFSDYYKLGVALSATYIPLQTNLYELKTYVDLGIDESFLSDFHYKYGFYRKALYIDNSTAAATNGYVTSLKGTQRIATLQDLFKPEQDIVLYLDNNFYNADEIAKMQGYVWEAIRNTEASDVVTETVTQEEESDLNKTGKNEGNLTGADTSRVVDSATLSAAQKQYERWNQQFRTMFDVDFEQILKTRAVPEYSTKFFQGVTKFGRENFFDMSFDRAIWDDVSLVSYLSEDEYTVGQSYAVVSAIYKDTQLFNTIQSECRTVKPVFVSSPKVASLANISESVFNSIYNYIMIKNLDHNLSYDYKSTLDMSSPIFMDIYGNICTESGLVVIPSAANATLTQPDYYTPWTAAFLSLYSGEYQLPMDYTNSEKYMGEFFAVDEEKETWKLRAKNIGGVYMNFDYLPLQTDGILNTLYGYYYENIAKADTSVDFDWRVYIITEILRGAPLENIDYEKEGIVGNRAVSKLGISMAYKLDDLSKQMLSSSNGNSLVTIPNLAYMDKIEYIMLFLFKIMFAAMMAGIVITVYKDTVSGRFGIKSIFSSIVSTALCIIGILLVPKLLDWSYYNTNKFLLRDDVSYLAMLNLEKDLQGKEIGVSEITTPESSTVLYMKLDNVDIPWYEMVDDVLTSDSFETAEQMYADQFSNNPIAQKKFVIQKANGLYVSLSDILHTSSIGYNTYYKIMYQSVTEPNIFSYCSSYYVILDQLVANVNAYNSLNDMLSYSQFISGDGKVKTRGLVAPYFLSDYWMSENYDITGFHALYDDYSKKIRLANSFTPLEIEQMKYSAWWMEDYDGKSMALKIDGLEDYAREWVSENRGLLGKVSDETFLKMLALNMAIEYNRMFRIRTASSIEVFNLDSKDLLRLTVGNKEAVFKNSSYSFARYVYEEGGTFAVVVMGCFIAVIWITSILKPMLLIVIFILLIVSLICRKVLFQKSSRAYEGYLISSGCLCACNLVYALMLKLTVSMGDWVTVTPAVTILASLVVQILYVLILVKLLAMVVKDWRNLGFTQYEVLGANVVQAARNTASSVNDFFTRRNNTAYAEVAKVPSELKMSFAKTGLELLAAMNKRDEERLDNVYNNPEKGVK